jgi:hypothetical protein
MKNIKSFKCYDWIQHIPNISWYAVVKYYLSQMTYAGSRIMGYLRDFRCDHITCNIERGV